jgi:hypothetical protein
MEESVAGAIQEFDEAISLSWIVPFHFAPYCRRGWFEFRFGRLLWGLGNFRRLARVFLPDDLPASLMDVSPSF